MKKIADIVFEPEAPITTGHKKKHDSTTAVQSESSNGSDCTFTISREKPLQGKVHSFHDLAFEEKTEAGVSRITKIEKPDLIYKVGDSVLVYDRYNAVHIGGRVDAVNYRSCLCHVKFDDLKLYGQWCSSSHIIGTPSQYVIKMKVF